jgi:hypothetical protein
VRRRPAGFAQHAASSGGADWGKGGDEGNVPLTALAARGSVGLVVGGAVTV